MSKQKILFDNPADAAVPDTRVLVIAAVQLGPEQTLFNQLLEKIEKQSQDLENLKAIGDAHSAQCTAKLAPLRQQVYEAQEKMVIFLDQRLQAPPNLPGRAKRDMHEILTFLLGSLLDSGEPSVQLQDMAERYFPIDDGNEGEDEDGLTPDEAAELNSAMAKAMGVNVDPDAKLSSEEFIEALMQKMQADEAAAHQAHEARQAKRKKSPKQKKAEQEELDAHSALRNIYRKLASVLHPDRETDPAERVRKTALMVRVNAANDRKDLLALLRLQLEIDQIDPTSVMSMADGKLRSFNRMLKNQLKELQAEYHDTTGRIHMAFDLGFGDVNAKSLMHALRLQTQRLQLTIDHLNQDLVLVQDDKALKKWLKEQTKALDDMEF